MTIRKNYDSNFKVRVVLDTKSTASVLKDLYIWLRHRRKAKAHIQCILL
jgi:hypothetical protein